MQAVVHAELQAAGCHAHVYHRHMGHKTHGIEGRGAANDMPAP